MSAEYFGLDAVFDKRTIEVMVVVKTVRPGLRPTYQILDGNYGHPQVVLHGDYLVEPSYLYQPSLEAYALAVDLYLAQLFGALPGDTLSAHVARIISEVTGIPFAVAKSQFHRVLTRLVAGAIHHHRPWLSARRIERSLFVWLESFDPENK